LDFRPLLVGTTGTKLGDQTDFVQKARSQIGGGEITGSESKVRPEKAGGEARHCQKRAGQDREHQDRQR
jgi:hypothetical protein